MLLAYMFYICFVVPFYQGYTDPTGIAADTHCIVAVNATEPLKVKNYTAALEANPELIDVTKRMVIIMKSGYDINWGLYSLSCLSIVLHVIDLWK